jgi:outer membrane protein
MKNNIRILCLTLAVVFGLGATAVYAEKDKIGYVDLSRIFDEYTKTKDYDKVLEQKSKAFEDSRNQKLEKIREQQGKLGLLAEDKKKTLEADIEKLKADLLEFDRQNRTDLTKERNEKIREILLEIEKVVSEFAEKEGYTVILNDRVLIYGAKSYDVTDSVMTKLNEGKK